MQVRDDEVRVVDLPVERERGEEDPGQAADREQRDEAEREQHRRVEDEVSAPGRREPVEDLHPGRHGDDHRRDHEEAVQRVGSPTANMWCAQTSSEKKPIADRREDDRLVAEDRLPREDGDDLGDDPHRGQDHHVDLGVPEEPEDVLVEQRVPALVRLEEVRAGLAVEQQHRQPGRERGQDDDRACRRRRRSTRRRAAGASTSSRACACGGSSR